MYTNTLVAVRIQTNHFGVSTDVKYYKIPIAIDFNSIVNRKTKKYTTGKKSVRWTTATQGLGFNILIWHRLSQSIWFLWGKKQFWSIGLILFCEWWNVGERKREIEGEK